MYDVLGRVVTTLAQGRQTAGVHRVEWDGREASGRMAASGVYLVRLQAGDLAQVRPAVLLK